MTDAWREMSKKEADRAFKRAERFFVRRSNGGALHRYAAPAPSIVYAVAHLQGARASDLADEAHEAALRLFRAVVAKDDALIAFDFHSVIYAFSPHRFTPVSQEDWAVPAIPDGDFPIFLHSSLDCGWLGHPWEATVCLFGERLLRALKTARPAAFRNPVRRTDVF